MYGACERQAREFMPELALMHDGEEITTIEGLGTRIDVGWTDD